MYAPSKLAASQARQQPVRASEVPAVNPTTLQSIEAPAALRDGVSHADPRSRAMPSEYLESAIHRA